MKILFVSGELIAGDLPYRLLKEGHEVLLFIEDDSREDCLDNMVAKTKDWKKELDWVGKDGLIVFDDIGYGKEQDNLRKMGYNVFGGCEEGDKMERDRGYAQKIFSDYGIKTVETLDFTDFDEAIEYVEKHKNPWVLKQNGHFSSFCFVGKDRNGSDVLSLLRSYKRNMTGDFSISLQKRVYGVEVGVARYFNGNDWVGPIEMNIEHKSFLNGNIGPLTAEMGTLMWYEKSENTIFKKTLGRLKPYLQEIGYKGDIDINCIVNSRGIVPLEATMRFGSPAIHLHDEIHLSPWGEFLMAMSKGEQYDLKYRKGFSVVVSVAIPPFPYHIKAPEIYLKEVRIFFKKELTPAEWKRVHFEEVYLKEPNTDDFRVAGSNGFILYVSGSGTTVEKARKSAYSLIDKIIIPKMMYRTDIGAEFMKGDGALLKKWGWV